jgi:hypothetical protein
LQSAGKTQTNAKNATHESDFATKENSKKRSSLCSEKMAKRTHIPLEKQHWRRWYSGIWWKRRQAAQMRREPFCRTCGSIASVADHIEPHRGQKHAFAHGKLQSLCRTCHETKKKTEEHRGFDTAIGLDGYPLDPRHPFLRADPAYASAEQRANVRFVPPLDDDADEELLNDNSTL